MRLRSALAAVLLLTLAACTSPAPARKTPAPSGGHGDAPARPGVVGYFTNWGVYGRDYQVKDVETSGAADRLTDLVYAFGQVKGGRCAPNDAWADYQRPATAAGSVDGAADDSASPLKGNFGQLAKLKARHPGLRLIWSFGGWSGSDGFTAAAADPAGFAASCAALLHDKRWPGLFNGVDIDWEYPNACGLTCDKSGADALSRILSALRSALGADALITAAVPGDVSKLTRADYATAATSANWFHVMTYDYFGTAADGPGDDSGDLHHIEPHSPLTSYPGIPRQSATTSATVDELLKLGVPAAKVLLGVGFYGRGWTGVTSSGAGSPATGPADGTYEKGIENYGILAKRCPPTGVVGGTAYGFCGSQWWSYDTPETIKTKMAYARSRGLGGAFAWELSGDDSAGSLIKAMAAGLG